jgi:thioredoxin-like negative regulator of GroEL
MVEDYDGTQNLDESVVRFTAEWCVPCRQYAPYFEAASELYAGGPWVVVDVDAWPDIARQFNIMSIPAVFDGGVKVEDYLGWTRKIIR